MEESESGINLQKLSNDGQDEAKKKEAKEQEEREGTLTPSSQECYCILAFRCKQEK